MKIITRNSCEENLRVRAAKEDMFFILDIIISLTQVASRGRGGIQSCCFKAKGVDTKSETSHTVKNDIMMISR